MTSPFAYARRGGFLIERPPRGAEALDYKISVWEARGINRVVSCLMPYEREGLELEQEEEAFRRSRIAYSALTEQGISLPPDAKLIRLLKHLACWAASGEKILLYATGDGHKAQMLAGGILVANGTAPLEALTRVCATWSLTKARSATLLLWLIILDLKLKGASITVNSASPAASLSASAKALAGWKS
jgi:hypothetical protein